MVGVKLPMLAALAASLCCGVLTAGLSPEAGSFVFQYYAPKTYNASPQNWAIAQDRRGIMYFGNTECILEYDGVTWRKIPLTNGSGVRSLVVDSRGTVYAGGVGVFGYLKSDQTGTLQFVSLMDQLSEGDRKFSDVWTILATPNGTYFQSYQRLFRLGLDGRIKAWKPEKRFNQTLFQTNGSIYVTDSSAGLLRMVNDRLEPVAGVDALVGNGVVSAASLGEATLLATNAGLYTFGGGQLRPFPTRADAYLQKNTIYSAYRMADGEIAIGTRKGGMVLLDQQGNLDRIVGRDNGLKSDWVTAFFSDREAGVWVSLNSGIARFESTLTQFGTQQGLRGDVLSVARQGGSIYVGTTSGLFRMNTAEGADPSFDAVDLVNQSVYVFQQDGSETLVGCANGLFRVSGTKATQILSSRTVFDLERSRHDPNLLYAAGRDGVRIFRNDGGTWSKVAEEAGTNQTFRTVTEDPDGRLWSTTQSDIWRIDFGTKPPKTERFTAAEGVPKGWKSAYFFRGHVVFATGKGLLRFDEKQRRFQPDNEIGNQFSDGSKVVSIVREDDAKNVWVTGEGYYGVLKRRQDGGYRWVPMPLVRSGIQEMYQFYVDPDGTCWAFGSDYILFRWADPRTNILDGPLDVLTRRVVEVSAKESLFYGGSLMEAAIRLPYRDRALRFEFAAPSFESEASIDYQVRLDGADLEWTPPSHETRKEYTNLPEHNYEFRVRARNSHGIVSPEARFAFKVLPPWYRTWWAYILWAAAGVLVVWGIVRWRLRALQARNEKLEQIVEERTVEVRMQRDQIQAEERKSEALLTNILPTSVAGELKLTGSVTPMGFDDVTVCFTDFVGFTLSSEKLPPKILVSALNDYFTAFDEITGRYGLEKLKTIGDAYMLVSGLPQTKASHAVDAVLAAIEMAETVKRLSAAHPMVKWKVRIGLHSGPVIAGVVGVRKFAFDIWGDTVNFAARMESSGSAGRVNMSATTYSRVKEFIDCEYRGQVRIKEGRELDMYFANGPSPNLGGHLGDDGIPEAFRQRYEEAFHYSPASFPALLVNAANVG